MAAEPRSHLNWLIALALLVLAVALRLPGMIGWWINPDEGAYFSMVTWKEWEPFWTEVAGHAHTPCAPVAARPWPEAARCPSSNTPVWAASML